MYGVTDLCIVMHMRRSRWPGPAGTPAARSCGCCSATRSSRSARSPPRRAPASRWAASTRTCPAGRPGARRHHARGARRPRRRLPRPAARALRGRSPPQLPADVVVIDCGADYRLADAGGLDRASTTARTPAPGPTACPSCPPAAPQRDALAGATPDRRARLLPDGASSLALAPAWPPGCSSPTTSSSSRPSGTSGAGRSLKPHLLGTEVMGSMSPYGVGGVHRHTPEIEQNLAARRRRPGDGLVHARRWRRCRAASSPRAPPGCARDADRRRRARAPGRRPTPTSRSSTCCPRARWPRTGRRRSAPTPCTCRSRVDERRRPGRRRRRRRQPHQGHRRRRRPVRQPRPRPARDHRPARGRAEWRP